MTHRRGSALLHAGWIAWEQVDYERSEALGEEALALARELGDRAATARALYIQGAPTLYQLDFDGAAACSRKPQGCSGVGDVAGLARTIQALGLTATARHDFMRAAELHEESLALAREAGDQIGIIVALGMGAFAYLGQGDHRRAMNLFREGFELSRSLGTKHGIAFHLHAAAALASTRPTGSLGAAVGSWRVVDGDIGTGLARWNATITDPTSTPHAPCSGRRRGKRRSPRGGRCRLRRPQSLPSLRKSSHPRESASRRGNGRSPHSSGAGGRSLGGTGVLQPRDCLRAPSFRTHDREPHRKYQAQAGALLPNRDSCLGNTTKAHRRQPRLG